MSGGPSWCFPVLSQGVWAVAEVTSAAHRRGFLVRIMSGVQANWGSSKPLWMGFAKVLGSQSQTPLALQGYMSIVKIG